MTTVADRRLRSACVAIQHVLERVRNAGRQYPAISPAHLLNMSSSINRPVELLVVGCSGLAEQDVGLLSQSMAFFMPRLSALVLGLVLTRAPWPRARAGVAGYPARRLQSDAPVRREQPALAGGECYPQPVARPPGAAHAPTQELRELTQRQEEILQPLVQGKTMREIGEQVGISVATVKSHARTLYWKLNARNQAEAAYIAVQMGLVRNRAAGVPTLPPGAESTSSVVMGSSRESERKHETAQRAEPMRPCADGAERPRQTVPDIGGKHCLRPHGFRAGHRCSAGLRTCSRCTHPITGSMDGAQHETISTRGTHAVVQISAWRNDSWQYLFSASAGKTRSRPHGVSRVGHRCSCLRTLALHPSYIAMLMGRVRKHETIQRAEPMRSCEDGGERPRQTVSGIGGRIRSRPHGFRALDSNVLA